jgi:hypothetical protein
MKKLLSKLAIVLGILLLIYTAFWWAAYKYRDCLKVGHSKTYCVLDMGK